MSSLSEMSVYTSEKIDNTQAFTKYFAGTEVDLGPKTCEAVRDRGKGDRSSGQVFESEIFDTDRSCLWRSCCQQCKL